MRVMLRGGAARLVRPRNGSALGIASAYTAAVRSGSGSSSSSSTTTTTSNDEHDSTTTTATQRVCGAVNVDAFTLNEEVVKRDMASLARWNALAEAVAAARVAGDDAAVLRVVRDGLAQLAAARACDGAAADATPIQCETLLHMEAAQAHHNLGDYAAAYTSAQHALAALVDDDARTATMATMAAASPAMDLALVAEVRTLMAQVLCKQGKAREAHDVFADVLHWVDVDAKTAPPMQAVAALQLRRTLLTGLAQSRMQLADDMLAGGGGGGGGGNGGNRDDTTATAAVSDSGADVTAARERYAGALDTFIDALNAHLDEKDDAMVKTTLAGIAHCFEALGDVAQAVQTQRKYISWCSKHDDAVGVVYGKQQLRALNERHGLPKDKDDTSDDHAAAAAAAAATASAAAAESPTHSSSNTTTTTTTTA